ncbi:MAG: alpha/beta hydrolase [Microthrixaceae bacterium]|nr:alpha/beta hydrolase [Microthrixaceae bacterium]
MSHIVDPITGPVLDEPVSAEKVAAPRLARHQIHLADGHPVGISVAGSGIPLVVVHGFSAEGFLYAQTLSRLVEMGFKVIAIDTAGHGNTQGLPYDGQNLTNYSELLGRIIDELGIERFVLAGHSMGGRLVTQLAADRPEQTIAVILVDAIVGDTWDKMVYVFRLAPPLLVGVGITLIVDSIGVLPLFRDPRQAAKLVRLVTPTIAGHLMRPWRLAGPIISILRSRSSRYALNELADHGVPLFALHGNRDYAVPLRTAREAVARTNGTLVTIEGAGHSWLLRDPESMPAIVAELLEGNLGDACTAMLKKLGLGSKSPTVEQIEAVCYHKDARIFSLTPMSHRTHVVGRHRRPKYHWSTSHAEDGSAVA